MIDSITSNATFFEVDVPRFIESLLDLEAKIALVDVPRRDSLYEALLEAMSRIRSACRRLEANLLDRPEELAAARSRFRRAIAPWMDQSPLMRHAKRKPSGYPGDFQMLRAIYGRTPLSHGFGGYVDLFFQDTELGRAVPARMESLRRFLRDEVLSRPSGQRVLNIACGPCREFAEGSPWGTQRRDLVVCVDFDATALEFSQEAVNASRRDGVDFEFVRYNALRLAAPGRFQKSHGQFDIAYSVGLFDYLSDRQLAGVVSGMRRLLRDDGALYLAFKDMNRYDKTDYQWLVDWFFFQRTEEDVRALLADAGCPDEDVAIARDDTGVILNCVVRGTAVTEQRVDAAHGKSRGARRRRSASFEQR